MSDMCRCEDGIWIDFDSCWWISTAWNLCFINLMVIFCVSFGQETIFAKSESPCHIAAQCQSLGVTKVKMLQLKRGEIESTLLLNIHGRWCLLYLAWRMLSCLHISVYGAKVVTKLHFVQNILDSISHSIKTPALSVGPLGLYMDPNNLCCVAPHFLLFFLCPMSLSIRILLRHVTFYKHFTYIFIL